MDSFEKWMDEVGERVDRGEAATMMFSVRQSEVFAITTWQDKNYRTARVSPDGCGQCDCPREIELKSGNKVCERTGRECTLKQVAKAREIFALCQD